jgi:hypothetical protein
MGVLAKGYQGIIGRVGRNSIRGEDGSIYLDRFFCYSFRLHIFHRGDQDPDCHDHPWGFWTFPLTPYVEEFLTIIPYGDGRIERIRQRRVVEAFRVHFRPAEFAHRVLGRYRGNVDVFGRPLGEPGKIVTLVRVTPISRKWGFWKERAGRWCWDHWKEYQWRGGKNAPCADIEGKKP